MIAGDMAALSGLRDRLHATVLAQSPPPQDGGYPDAELVTPGTIGFVATFLLVLAVVLLARSLSRRQRRMRARVGAVRRHPIPVERGPRTSRTQGPGIAQTRDPEAQAPREQDPRGQKPQAQGPQARPQDSSRSQ